MVQVPCFPPKRGSWLLIQPDKAISTEVVLSGFSFVGTFEINTATGRVGWKVMLRRRRMTRAGL